MIEKVLYKEVGSLTSAHFLSVSKKPSLLAFSSYWDQFPGFLLCFRRLVIRLGAWSAYQEVAIAHSPWN